MPIVLKSIIIPQEDILKQENMQESSKVASHACVSQEQPEPQESLQVSSPGVSQPTEYPILSGIIILSSFRPKKTVKRKTVVPLDDAQPIKRKTAHEAFFKCKYLLL